MTYRPIFPQPLIGAEVATIHEAAQVSGRIIREVAKAADVTVQEIRGKSRSQSIVYARQLACYKLVQAGFSLSEVGRILKRDHTTVMHACKVVRGRLEAAQ